MSNVHVVDKHVIIVDRRGSTTGIDKLIKEVRLIADKHFFGHERAKLAVVYHMDSIDQRKLFVCSTRRMNEYQTQPHAKRYVADHPFPPEQSQDVR